MICRFCDLSFDVPELVHLMTCDGRQGKIEAAQVDPADVPILASGLVEETYATSRTAAASIAEGKAAQRALVYHTIDRTARYGRTDDDVQAELGLDGSSERPRRWELWKLGLITILRDEAGSAVKRETRTGRRAVVWITARWDRTLQKAG